MLDRIGSLKGVAISDSFNIHSIAKYQKNEEGTIEVNENFSKKVSQCQKTERGCFVIFQHPFPAKHQKLKGDPLEK